MVLRMHHACSQLSKAALPGVALAVLAISPVNGETMLFQDPLNGKTIGRADGSGTFLPEGGWRSSGGRIIFDVPGMISDGYFQAKMRGFSLPAAGSTDKSHPLSVWTGTRFSHHSESSCFAMWRIGNNYAAYKVLASNGGLALRQEARVGNASMATAGGNLYRMDFQNGKVAFSVDGKVLKTFSFPAFKVRYFVIGRDAQYPLTSPAPIISDVLIVTRGGATSALVSGRTQPLSLSRGRAERTIIMNGRADFSVITNHQDLAGRMVTRYSSAGVVFRFPNPSAW